MLLQIFYGSRTNYERSIPIFKGFDKFVLSAALDLHDALALLGTIGAHPA
jgi:hypothetical protein